ncbi:KLD7A protein, partial [Xiphorhynchus elegans]|nr:KLD7A protein [Xiphorhynchus elegans]
KMPQRAALSWQCDMQLAGKLVLSAAALLLLTLAYRFYKTRSLAGGKIPLDDEGEHGENASRDGDGNGDGDGDSAVGLRRRRVLGEEVRRDGGDAPRSIPGTRHSPLRRDPSVPREEEEGEEVISEQLGPARRECEVGSELGCKLGSKAEGKPGIEVGSDPGVEPGSKLGNELRNELGREPGNELGIKPGNNPGSNFGLSPGICNAQMAGEGCAQSTEKDWAGGGTNRETRGNREPIQTLSVTSNLGLMMTTSDVGSDTSYSFSSVAKIQVEENYITEGQVRDGDNQPVPGLRGKVYDYYVQTTSESVLKKKCLPYIPPGTSQHRSSEQVKEELQSSETQKQDPALATSDPTSSSTVPPPTICPETSPEPPSPGRKNSILQIADSPHLQLPMEGFGGPSPAGSPPASPQPGLVAGPDPLQLPPHPHLELGNCYEVLSAAKVQKLRPLQDAAYKVMSDNYLQVLRTPSIYGRLNARERELILQRRMKGKTCMVVADVNAQEPDLHPSHLSYYDEGGDRWHRLCQVPPEVVSRGCATCSMFNYLFVVAGCKGTGRAQRPSNRVFCYDPLTDIWREICPLNQARPHCKLVALDGHLYAIGGECLYTVERYDPRQDRWVFVAPLPHDTFAVAHTATVCDGEIYVTGGTLRYVLLRYDPRLDSWRASPAIGSKDRTAEMVSTSGFIYRFDLQHGTGVSVHRCGAKAKLWYECATCTLPDLAGFQCTVVGSLVHCIGRHFHLRFLADHISPRFGAKELQPFPSPHGSLLAAVLVLPEGGQAQTRL